MKILVLNSGSSSQKSCLYDIGNVLPDDPPACLWQAKIEWEGEVAEASRRKLEERLPSKFIDAVIHAGIAKTLVTRPPKNLFVQSEGAPQFGAQDKPLSTTRELLDAVWRVRNNLFHGNKLYPADRARDEALMTDVLDVIDAIMKVEGSISSAFHDPQQFF